jgi:tetratricopeptide (TPR) repeat protein
MKNKVLIFVIALFVTAVSAQQKPASTAGKGATPLSTNNNQLPTNNTFAVVVGISDYQDPGIPDLRFADKDAKAFADYLRSNAGNNLDDDHLKVLINEQATLAQFAIQLDWLLENAKENDRVIIYFSGHGDVEKKTLTQPGFLLCWDAPAQVYMSGGAFALPMLQEVISTLSIQNKSRVIVITDACRSGKLSGSSIHGNQLTNANLAKQYTNEIKILSCQPNEYSIEGEQWGGGRGAFSYNLINALYGMADQNNDLIVNLQEAGRYLEDHVTAEVAPVSQVPMILGSRTEILSKVDPSSLDALKSGKSTQQTLLTSIDVKGIEEDVLTGVDTSIRLTYKLFKQALKDKQFLPVPTAAGEPANTTPGEGQACADTYYMQLIREPGLARLHSTMTRNYAAALQDDAQQILNYSSKAQLREYVLSPKLKVIKYSKYARYLERAAELLGKDHYMYDNLMARKYFFEGWSIRLSGRGPDTIKGNQALQKFRTSLEYEKDLPQVYKQLCWTFAINFRQPDSAEYYAKIAVEKAPTWAVPFSELGYLLSEKFQSLDKAKYYLDLALKIDSSTAYTWNYMGNYYLYIKQYSEAEKYYRKSIQLDVGYVDPYYNLACSLSLQNRIDEAYQSLDKALEIGYDYDWINGDADLILVRQDADRWKALMKKYFPGKD